MISPEKSHTTSHVSGKFGSIMISHCCFFYAWTLFSQKSPDFRYFPRAIILRILRTFGRQEHKTLNIKYTYSGLSINWREKKCSFTLLFEKCLERCSSGKQIFEYGNIKICKKIVSISIYSNIVLTFTISFEMNY